MAKKRQKGCQKLYKGDFHTHSEYSPRGSISLDRYQAVLDDGVLDYVAVTDQGTISPIARSLAEQYGSRAIIGEEILTRGLRATGRNIEIIGLFLREEIKSDYYSLLDTARAIREQQAVVYVPRPFEILKHGVSHIDINSLHAEGLVDVVETYTGLRFPWRQDYAAMATVWASLHREVSAAFGSDAHGNHGFGRTYTPLSGQPTAENFTQVLCTDGAVPKSLGLLALGYPLINGVEKR